MPGELDRLEPLLDKVGGEELHELLGPHHDVLFGCERATYD